LTDTRWAQRKDSTMTKKKEAGATPRQYEAAFKAEAVRWPPKVGQVGSLTQSQNNDPHVKEATSTQSRSESQSWS
jgi:hypothetical protein